MVLLPPTFVFQLFCSPLKGNLPLPERGGGGKALLDQTPPSRTPRVYDTLYSAPPVPTSHNLPSCPLSFRTCHCRTDTHTNDCLLFSTLCTSFFPPVTFFDFAVRVTPPAQTTPSPTPSEEVARKRNRSVPTPLFLRSVSLVFVSEPGADTDQSEAMAGNKREDRLRAFRFLVRVHALSTRATRMPSRDESHVTSTAARFHNTALCVPWCVPTLTCIGRNTHPAETRRTPTLRGVNV